MDPALAYEIAALSRQKAMVETMDLGTSEIQCFYKDSVVFLTGGSGFLGKQLMHKLFRACELKKVYVLIRPKKDKSTQERLLKILEDPIYDDLKKKKPGFIGKLEAVEGDVTKLRLGINDADWKKLTEEVHVVFHVAATTRFDEPLRNAILTNVRGTREAALLAQSCKALRSFVHVSTAYSHATPKRFGQRILEDFYESPSPPAAMIELAENLEEERLNSMTPTLLAGWPNTYSYTKAMAEEVVRSTCIGLPVCIVRPSIVICSYRDPLPGWLDMSCAFGPSGILLGTGMGIMRTMIGSEEIQLDLIPVDLVNNSIIAAGKETADRFAGGQTETKIYTVTSNRNPITFGFLTETIRSEGRQLITPKSLWYCFLQDTPSFWMYWILHIFLHVIPGYLMDLGMFLTGNEPVFRKLYTKVDKLSQVLGYYTSNDWDFSDQNLQVLEKHMSDSDKVIFNVNVNTVDWKECLTTWCLGIRKYIIKDGLKDTDYAIKKQYWLKIAHKIVLCLYGYGLYKLLIIGVYSLFYVVKFLLG